MTPWCLALGDSIALGIGTALAALLPGGCVVHARVGAHAAEMKRWSVPSGAKAVIISAGSNDDASANVERSLVRLRDRLGDARIIWVYPRSPAKAWMIFRIARAYGDHAIGISRYGSRDGIHPDHYPPVARFLRTRIKLEQPLGAERLRRTAGNPKNSLTAIDAADR